MLTLTFFTFRSWNWEKVFTVWISDFFFSFLLFFLLFFPFFSSFYWNRFRRKEFYKNISFQASRSLVASPNNHRMSKRITVHLVPCRTHCPQIPASLQGFSWPGVIQRIVKWVSIYWVYPKLSMPLFIYSQPFWVEQGLTGQNLCQTSRILHLMRCNKQRNSKFYSSVHWPGLAFTV